MFHLPWNKGFRQPSAGYERVGMVDGLFRGWEDQRGTIVGRQSSPRKGSLFLIVIIIITTDNMLALLLLSLQWKDITVSTKRMKIPVIRLTGKKVLSSKWMVASTCLSSHCQWYKLQTPAYPTLLPPSILCKDWAMFPAMMGSPGHKVDRRIGFATRNQRDGLQVWGGPGMVLGGVLVGRRWLWSGLTSGCQTVDGQLMGLAWVYSACSTAGEIQHNPSPILEITEALSGMWFRLDRPCYGACSACGEPAPPGKVPWILKALCSMFWHLYLFLLLFILQSI